MLIFHSIFEWLYWRETSGTWLNPSLILEWILIQWEREAMCDALLEPSQKGVGILRMVKSWRNSPPFFFVRGVILGSTL